MGKLYFYNTFLQKSGRGAHDFGSDTLKVALLGSGYTFDRDSGVVLGDISTHEIAVGGYTAGGVALTGVTWTRNDASDLMTLDADDPQWIALSTATIRHAILYNSTASNRLIARIEITENSNGGNYTIILPGDGIFKLYQVNQ